MSENPLEPDPGREHRIRERAYHLWNDEGRPHGHHDEFWERARELVAMEESAGAGQLPNPQTTGEDPRRGEPVEEAFLLENLGEFPDHRTDQGNGAAMPKRATRPAAKREPQAAPRLSPEALPAKPSLKAKLLKQEAKSPAAAPKKRKPKH